MKRFRQLIKAVLDLHSLVYCCMTHGDVSQPAGHCGDDRQFLLSIIEGFRMLLPNEDAATLAGSGEPVEGQLGRRRNGALNCYTILNTYIPRALLRLDIGVVTFST